MSLWVQSYLWGRLAQVPCARLVMLLKYFCADIFEEMTAHGYLLAFILWSPGQSSCTSTGAEEGRGKAENGGMIQGGGWRQDLSLVPDPNSYSQLSPNPSAWSCTADFSSAVHVAPFGLLFVSQFPFPGLSQSQPWDWIRGRCVRSICLFQPGVRIALWISLIKLVLKKSYYRHFIFVEEQIINIGLNSSSFASCLTTKMFLPMPRI